MGTTRKNAGCRWCSGSVRDLSELWDQDGELPHEQHGPRGGDQRLMRARPSKLPSRLLGRCGQARPSERDETEGEHVEQPDEVQLSSFQRPAEAVLEEASLEHECRDEQAAKMTKPRHT